MSRWHWRRDRVLIGLICGGYVTAMAGFLGYSFYTLWQVCRGAPM